MEHHRHPLNLCEAELAHGCEALAASGLVTCNLPAALGECTRTDLERHSKRYYRASHGYQCRLCRSIQTKLVLAWAEAA